MSVDVGVIVGRFQVESLHEGHRFLINKAFENHRKVVIFIGVSPIQGTKHDPLDYQTRARAIQSEYPDAILLPLHDKQSDEVWSDQLDSAVTAVIPNISKAMLYGGRDSFQSHYKGRFTTVKVESAIRYHSGTEQREDLGKVVRNSPDFRAGIIYSTQNSWPYVKMCVDIAVLTVRSSGMMVLLGRKNNEVKWRLPGGMVDKGRTLECEASKELREETGIDIIKDDFKYLMSTPVGDWRMKQAGEIGLLTSLFAVRIDDTEAVAGDDLCEVKWFELRKAHEGIMPGHRPLINFLKKEYLP
jgi:bifunctional NMN adenylyltransferase/nudix hydrolase